MDGKKIYLVGNAHLDPVWLWRWPEGMAEVKETFRSALDRMKEFPDFYFTSACTCYYEWVEKNEPDMFEEIKERVKEGRWMIAGGWFIQPDCNTPSGESFARQSLYGQRYFLEKFGKIAKTGYNVDSFGHNGMLPQILKLSGMNQYVFMRPGKHEKDMPFHVFDWKSPDGSQVRTFRIIEAYNSQPKEAERLKGILAEADKSPHDLMGFFGVGNHGGGPTIQNLKVIQKLMAENPGRFQFSSPDEYFEKADFGEVPVVEGDLQHHARGCYSAHSKTKALNRSTEHLLLSAEKLAVTAGELFDLEYPEEDMKRAWKDLMFNQFHDIMGGCSIKEAYEDAEQQFGEAQTIGKRALHFALQKISWNIDTIGPENLEKPADKKEWFWRVDEIGTPFVLYNPLSWPVKTVVSCGSIVNRVTDDKGNPVPMQLTRTSRTCDDNLESVFEAEIPAFGYTVYRLFNNEACKDVVAKMPPVPEGLEMENDWLRVKIDAATGMVSELYDKKNHQDVLKGVALARVINEETSDTWGHGIDSYQDEVGRFGNAQARMIEHGPVRTIIRAVSYYEQSILRQDYILTHDKAELEVRTEVDWREKHRMLKLSFPVNVQKPRVMCEIAYGALERKPNGEEEHCQQWIDLFGENASGSTYGLGILNDSKYSYDAKDSLLSLTALRSPAYADHYGVRDDLCQYTEQGVQSFTYALCPHQGDYRDGDLVRKAYGLNCKPYHVAETFHQGKLPCRFEGISVSSSHVLATALKPSEDGMGTVLRLYETHGEPTEVEISLPFMDRKWTASFGAYEIKTFYLPKDKTAPVRETNLLEFDREEV